MIRYPLKLCFQSRLQCSYVYVHVCTQNYIVLHFRCVYVMGCHQITSTCMSVRALKLCTLWVCIRNYVLLNFTFSFNMLVHVCTCTCTCTCSNTGTSLNNWSTSHEQTKVKCWIYTCTYLLSRVFSCWALHFTLIAIYIFLLYACTCICFCSTCT